MDKAAAVEWYGEWKLPRLDDGAESSVQVIAPITREVGSMVEAAVSSILEKAAVKFSSRRWADAHAVVLERQHTFLTVEPLVTAMMELPPESFAQIDVVLLVDGDA